MVNFTTITAVIIGATIAVLIMTGAQLAFADVSWTEDGVLHTEKEQVTEAQLSWDDMISARVAKYRQSEQEHWESESTRRKPEHDKLRNDLWLQGKSFWEKLLM